MMMLLILQCYECVFDVPQENNTQKNAYISLSQKGLEKYGQLNLDKVFQGLLNKNLGNFTIDAGGFDFMLSNI